MLATHVAIEVILPPKPFRVIFAIANRAVESLAVGIVFRNMSRQVFPVLESLFAVVANMLATHVGCVRTEVVG